MLTQSQITQYHEKGYTILSNLFTREEAQAWKAQLQQVLTDDQYLDEGAGVRVFFGEDIDPLTTANVQSSKLVQALTQLIGPDVEFLSVKAVFKNAKTSFNSPWHQDWHYWQGSPKVSVWIALDDATPENGCLCFVPGSHLGVVEMDDVDDGKGFNRRISEENLNDLPVDIAPISAGDAIFFHDLLLHASCPNVNGQDRWTAISTYRSGSEKDSSTVWPTSTVLCGESVN